MYFEKMNPILNDLENKEIEIAGGSVVGMALSTINSLIKYIANLTINKKNYEDVQDKVKEILEKAENLKQNSLQAIDKDKELLEEILNAYKIRKENAEKYSQVCKQAVEFCMNVVNIANETLKLSDEISKVGNKMLSSDFKIESLARLLVNGRTGREAYDYYGLMLYSDYSKAAGESATSPDSIPQVTKRGAEDKETRPEPKKSDNKVKDDAPKDGDKPSKKPKEEAKSVQKGNNIDD